MSMLPGAPYRRTTKTSGDARRSGVDFELAKGSSRWVGKRSVVCNHVNAEVFPVRAAPGRDSKTPQLLEDRCRGEWTTESGFAGLGFDFVSCEMCAIRSRRTHLLVVGPA